MNNNEQYTVMVARREATARGLDYALDVWYPVSEHLRASLCKVCGAMVWVTRSARSSVGESGEQRSSRSAWKII